MNDNKNNPSAFPVYFPPSYDGGEFCARGMMLRDYFAAAAMHGLLSNPSITQDGIFISGKTESAVASAAFDMADAMLVQRTKG
jgi:hypothetical protein